MLGTLREAQGLIVVFMTFLLGGFVLFHNVLVTSALALHTLIAQSSSRRWRCRNR